MSLKFSATHRMLVKAVDGHDYETVEIDIVSGLYKRSFIKMTQTKIRVNKSILGENLMSRKPLGLDEIDLITKEFNEIRVAAGFDALDFRTEE